MRNTTLIIICCILMVWVIYNGTLTFYALKLKKKLKSQRLEVFINKLGTNYQYRNLGNGYIRHKWRKGWITVKADFDEAMLSYNEKIGFTFSKLFPNHSQTG